MGLLNYIQSEETLAETAQLDDQKIIEIWKAYLQTVQEKGDIILKLTIENVSQYIKRLRELLNLELAELSKEEDLEEEVIKDLRKLEHSKNIKRIHKLQDCLGYLETRYEYLDRLLVELYSVLVSESRSIKDLEAKPEEEIQNLKNLYEVEQLVITKITDYGKVQRIETFQEVLVSLVIGEKLIQRLNKREKTLYKRMKAIFHGVFTTNPEEQINDGMIAVWATEVVNRLENKVLEAINLGIIEGQNIHMDFEFVNKPEFVTFVREIKEEISNPNVKVSETSVNVFVHVFREWFNQRD